MTATDVLRELRELLTEADERLTAKAIDAAGLEFDNALRYQAKRDGVRLSLSLLAEVEQRLGA